MYTSLITEHSVRALQTQTLLQFLFLRVREYIDVHKFHLLSEVFPAKSPDPMIDGPVKRFKVLNRHQLFLGNRTGTRVPRQPILSPRSNHTDKNLISSYIAPYNYINLKIFSHHLVKKMQCSLCKCCILHSMNIKLSFPLRLLLSRVFQVLFQNFAFIKWVLGSNQYENDDNWMTFIILLIAAMNDTIKVHLLIYG